MEMICTRCAEKYLVADDEISLCPSCEEEVYPREDVEPHEA